MTNPPRSAFETLKKAPVLVTVVAAILAIGAWFGFDVKMPGHRFQEHVTQSDSVHRDLNARHDSGHAHDAEMEKLLEGMVRGECLENPRENLARQGLLPTCQKLGIEPR